MSALVVMLIILAVLYFLFLLLIFPVWTIIDCASSSGRSGAAKTVWIILMVIFWPLVSMCYGLFASGKRALQIVAGFSFVYIAVFVGGFFYLMVWLIGVTKSEFAHVRRMNPVIDMTELDAEERSRLAAGLEVITAELDLGWRNIEDVMRAASLANGYQRMTEDKKITQKEYDQFMPRFEMRRQIDIDKLDEFDDQFRG